MIKNHDTHSWIASFAGRLYQLRPGLGIGNAVACAVHSIHHAAEIDPRRAAEIFVLANVVPSRPVPVVRSGGAASGPYRARFGSPARGEQRIGA